MTSARLLSPVRRVGVTKVKQGFSMPPYGKEGGMQSTSYRVHAYGQVSASAACRNSSVSEKSAAAASTISGSAQMRTR